jgi:hypothetical protein
MGGSPAPSLDLITSGATVVLKLTDFRVSRERMSRVPGAMQHAPSGIYRVGATACSRVCIAEPGPNAKSGPGPGQAPDQRRTTRIDSDTQSRGLGARVLRRIRGTPG